MERLDEYEFSGEGCWTWPGSGFFSGKRASGYGNLKFNGKLYSVHRLAYEGHIGPIPSGMCVCHACDNRLCVNPAHLWVGSRGENNSDRAQKGRDTDRLGEKSPVAKLSEAQAIEVLRLVAEGVSQQKIANQFCLHQSTVSDIKRGKRWPHLDRSILTRKRP